MTTTRKEQPAFTLIEVPSRRSICETEMHYDVLFFGAKLAEVYFNMTGYVIDHNLPQPSGIPLSIGEQSITGIKRDLVRANREWAASGRLDIFLPPMRTIAALPQAVELSAEIHKRLGGKGYYTGAASMGVNGFRYYFPTPEVAAEMRQSLADLPVKIEG